MGNVDDHHDESLPETELDKAEDRQKQFKLEPSVEEGVDENGKRFQIIPLSMLKGGELKDTPVYMEPSKHIVNESNPSLRGWYKSKHEESPNARPRPCYSEAVLTTPYGGYCSVGCKFCYVDHGTRGYRATGIATVNPDYPEHMRKQIEKANLITAVYMSSFTEPFQLLEDEYHITERLTKVLVDEGLPIFYLSRRLPPEWAVDALLSNPYSYMQWSINTPNEATYRKISPGSYTIDEVLKKMRYLSDRGVYISIQCNPLLPGIMTLEETLELVRLIAQAGGHHMIFKMAEQVYSNRAMLLARLAKVPGVDEFDKLLNQTIGGVYTVQQDVRITWFNELLKATRENDITMSLCYEYYEDGKAGSNLSPYYTTSDQCHGRGVPVYYRPEPGQRFRPLPGCFRKGCLYCADYGTMACNNETLLQAKALKYEDYRNIRLVGNEAYWDLEDSCPRPEETTREGARNPDLRTDAERWGWSWIDETVPPPPEIGD
jgi:DNA repair photolyase